MNAIVCTKYGSPNVLQLKEVEKPSHKENPCWRVVFDPSHGVTARSHLPMSIPRLCEDKPLSSLLPNR
jgi:hypothetical protein